MKIREVLQNIKQIRIPEKGYPVEKTIAKEFIDILSPKAKIYPVEPLGMKPEPGVLYVAVANQIHKELLSKRGVKLPSHDEWVFFSVDEDGCCWLYSSRPCFLYAAFSLITEKFLEDDTSSFKEWLHEISFFSEKSKNLSS